MNINEEDFQYMLAGTHLRIILNAQHDIEINIAPQLNRLCNDELTELYKLILSYFDKIILSEAKNI